MDKTAALDVARPLPVALINRAGSLFARLGIHWPRLGAEALLARACKVTGLRDFGADDFRTGLGQLLASLNQEAKINEMGRILAYKQISDLLNNRLRLVDYRKNHPSVAKERVERPLFILGLPRTGTTILYNLLAQNPDCRSPLSWEVAEPCPPPEKNSYRSDPRIKKTEQQLMMLRKLIPGFDAIHPVGAELPQECISILAYAFDSLQFEINFDIPGYQQWYNSSDHIPAFQFHRQMLQHLQSRYSGDYWVLKTPAHLGTIEALLAVYPDARVVQTHRDPLKVLPSVSSLYYALRTLCSDEVDPHRLGQQMVDEWSDCLARGMAARDRLTQHQHQFYDVQFDDLLVDPFNCIERIYQHFDIPFKANAKTAMQNFLRANQRDKHGQHHYTLEMFGLDRNLAEVKEKFAPYCQRFNIPQT